MTISAASIAFRAANPVSIPDRVYREDYPVGAVSYMKQHGLKGRIWNEFDWGGFIVFSSRELFTAIDGRTAVLLFPPGYLEEWRDTADVKAGWNERLERGSPDFVLLYQDDFLSMELAQNPRGGFFTPTRSPLFSAGATHPPRFASSIKSRVSGVLYFSRFCVIIWYLVSGDPNKNY